MEDFIKMDGTGNDFVIFDGRTNSIKISESMVHKIANRTHPVTKGCDQIIVIESSENADCFMRIYNADGGEVDACGNASRCVGYILASTSPENKGAYKIATNSGIITAMQNPKNSSHIDVDMGQARFGWQDILLSKEMDTLHLDISEGTLRDPAAVSMGNPHAVFFVDNIDAIDFEKNNLGHNLEHNPIFPERANIGIAQITNNDGVNINQIKLRVFERGSGETMACGTGACAAVVAAFRRELLPISNNGRIAEVALKGGTLIIDWQENGSVRMSGPVNEQFRGELNLETEA